MRIKHAIAWTWAFVSVACFLLSPAAALDRATLQRFFAEPYSVGERDGELPIWPIFKKTGLGDQLIAYVFDYADFASAPVAPDEGINRLVAVGPSGEFLEAKVFRVKPAFLNWFSSEPGFDFIRRDRAADLAPTSGAATSILSPLGAIAGSRDDVRARLGLAQKGEAPAAPTSDAESSANFIRAALIVATIAAVAAFARRVASILAIARVRIRRFRAGRIFPALESPE